MENLPGLCETLETGRLATPGKAIAISPLTLRPRKKPELPAKDGGPDERQPTLFAAAWMLGSLVWCIRGEAASVTFGDIAGPGGVMTLDGSSGYPCYLVLAGAAASAGGAVRCGVSDDSSAVVGIAADTLAIAANITGEMKRVVVTGIADGCTCSVVEDRTCLPLKSAADPFRALRQSGFIVRGDNAELELPPYSLVFFFR